MEDLFAEFAQVRESDARFVETRTVSLLNAPLESSGILSYRRPDLFEKRTLQPEAESLRVDGDRLTLTRADGAARTLSVSSMPEIQTYVESIRATLRGDVPTMMRFYEVVLQGTSQEWRMDLTPRAAEARRMVRRIVIVGRRAAIRQIDVEQSDGDRSTMTILPDPA
ncbi:LolA-related protein [Azospirillum picis]|uniref:Outer membrane lipoprotein-sorting protein n=1 Tax=Azospirillum picis TaxID=488438 RepID=A0ABU0MR34_9PROT|nr:LolA-related protein [Azospirillum picis]MBP2302030.1 outer membrane lipoprotein-sorting protein [Azospirillum picis]MDQ0535679.1 outer membrane lipoprotein-sorting protein [Azospirillum picis]